MKKNLPKTQAKTTSINEILISQLWSEKFKASALSFRKEIYTLYAFGYASFMESHSRIFCESNTIPLDQ